jgi:hypothetical protein
VLVVLLDALSGDPCAVVQQTGEVELSFLAWLRIAVVA